MLLDDIGKTPLVAFKEINQHLYTNYGFKISEKTSNEDLHKIVEQIEKEIVSLKLNGDISNSSSEISKRMLILEGVKNLKEYAMMQLHSPKLDAVVSNLIDFVVETFMLSGTHHGDFEKAVSRAIDEYRSSKYRFPDDLIEQRVRDGAVDKIHSISKSGTTGTSEFNFPTVLEDTDAEAAEADASFNVPTMEDDEIDESSLAAMGRHAEREFADQVHDKDHKPVQVPTKYKTVRDKNGKLIRIPMPDDPWEAQKKARAAGFKPPVEETKLKGKYVMKEQANLVKNLRRLLETEVSQAEVMMAAKGFAQELQEMVEKIGRLQNEDLPPVTDQMREIYGPDSASAFHTQIYGAMQGVMDSLYTAKNQVDDAVTNMATTGQFTAGVDMEKDPEMGSPDLGDDSMPDEVPDDLDNISAELDSDEFGSAEEEDPLGRAMKEDAQTLRLKKKINEMRILLAKAKKLKESKKT